MPESPKPPKRSERSGRSTEYYGVGQSGYTAGRFEGDRSLDAQLESRNVAYIKDVDDVADELGLDDRFTGRGARPWAPEDPHAPGDKHDDDDA